VCVWGALLPFPEQAEHGRGCVSESREEEVFGSRALSTNSQTREKKLESR